VSLDESNGNYSDLTFTFPGLRVCKLNKYCLPNKRSPREPAPINTEYIEDELNLGY
jgi:hypothetical protein